jgi:hypothetical protein
MKDMLIDEFQYTVQELLFRNKSIIDSITKYQIQMPGSTGNSQGRHSVRMHQDRCQKAENARGRQF